MKKTFAFLSLLALAAGCVSVQRAENYHGVTIDGGRVPHATLEIENSVWLLFNFIPIASGDPSHPNENTCRWFKNTVTLANNMNVLEQAMDRDGIDTVANLTSRYTDEKYLFFLLARRACHTSCVLVKPEGETKEATK